MIFGMLAPSFFWFFKEVFLFFPDFLKKYVVSKYMALSSQMTAGAGILGWERAPRSQWVGNAPVRGCPVLPKGLFGFWLMCALRLICVFENQDSARVLKKLGFSWKPRCVVKPCWRKATKHKVFDGILASAGRNAKKKRIQTPSKEGFGDVVSIQRHAGRPRDVSSWNIMLPSSS
jgi:hypothetical protein